MPRVLLRYNGDPRFGPDQQFPGVIPGVTPPAVTDAGGIVTAAGLAPGESVEITPALLASLGRPAADGQSASDFAEMLAGIYSANIPGKWEAVLEPDDDITPADEFGGQTLPAEPAPAAPVLPAPILPSTTDQPQPAVAESE